MFLLTMLLLSTAGFVFWNSYNLSLERIESEQKQTLHNELNAVIRGYRMTAENIYKAVISRPEVTAMAAEAAADPGSRERVRAELYRLLLPLYEDLSLYNFRQLHFHLPDNTSLLRFHNYTEWEDDLSGLRATVVMVNKNGIPASGFEEGRFLNGYRFVFPLFYNGIQTGSVEISISMKAVVDSLSAMFPRKVLFLLAVEPLRESVPETLMNAYTPWSVSARFVTDPSMPELMFPAGELKLKDRYRLQTILESMPNEISVINTENGSAVLVYPVKDTFGRPSAYILTQLDNITAESLRSNFILAFSLLIVLGVFITFFAARIDITHRHLKYELGHDRLTGALSRSALLEKLGVDIKRFTRYGTSLSVILFDLDHFKQVNDTYGHIAGDALLRAFAETVIRNSRATDYFGRLGGDEFLLALPETDSTGAYNLAEQLLVKLNGISSSRFGTVSCSIGVGELQETDRIVDRLIERVDSGLYISKHRGRNRITVVNA